MNYMLCRHRVADFERWNRVFQSHAPAHREAGLHLLHLLRGVDDPNEVIFLFRVDDVKRAMEFTEAPGSADAGRESGVVGVPEIRLLRD